MVCADNNYRCTTDTRTSSKPAAVPPPKAIPIEVTEKNKNSTTKPSNNGSLFDPTLGGNYGQPKAQSESEAANSTAPKLPVAIYSTEHPDRKIGQAIAGATLILVVDLFIGLPCAYIIVVTGGVSPPAIAAEAVEVFVVLPANALGLYLIYDSTRK
jgi:hypothetical protein